MQHTGFSLEHLALVILVSSGPQLTLQLPCFDSQSSRVCEKILILPVNMTVRTTRTISAKAAIIITLTDSPWDFLFLFIMLDS